MATRHGAWGGAAVGALIGIKAVREAASEISWPSALAGLAAGCSSKPAYCTSADQLKTSADNLGNVNVAENGLGSLQTAVKSAQGQPPLGRRHQHGFSARSGNDGK